ncbi:HTH-type transcriptional regulator BenM [compost metagenome]
MDLYQLKYFLALAKELHFWNTASKMNITQSALTRNIQSLEKELGVQLFFRDKRNVKLTPAGIFLQEKWSAELDQLQTIHKAAQQIHLGEMGAIKIAHPDSISSSILTDLIDRILKKFPKLSIELIQLPYENQDDYLKNYKIDIALTRDVNQSSILSSRKVSSENLALIVSEKHYFNTLSDLSTQSLLKEKFILTTSDYQSSYTSKIDEIFSFYKISPKPYILSEFGSTIISLVKKGLGISILPHSYSLNTSDGVRFITLPFESELFITWRKDDHNPIINNVLQLI